MNCRQFSVALAAVAVLTARGAADVSADAEPRYQDKSLSEWIVLTEPKSVETFAPRDAQALEAVRRIGTNAIPWLLRWIRSEQLQTNHLAIRGISLLRTNANLLVPELTRLVNDWKSSTAWSNAIPALETLGNDGFFPLLRAATNYNAPSALRWKAVQSIGRLGSHMNGVGSLAMLGTNAAIAVPVLIRCLHDDDWRVAAEAASALGIYTIEPTLAVPALIASLQSRTNPPPPATVPDDDPYHWRGDVSVRWAAVHSLRDFGEVIHLGGFPQNASLRTPNVSEYRQAMQPAVPALVKALDDPDWRVASWAALALGEAGLNTEVVVPVLIRSVGHTNVWVRQNAAEALGNFGEAARPAVPALTRLCDDAFAGTAARIALEKIAPGTK
jgi:HEAT repeat protein